MSWTILRRPRLEGKDFRKEFVRAGVWVVGLAFLSMFLQWIGLYERFSLIDMDTLTRVNGRVTNDEIVLVTIGNEDYRNMFGARSPLNSEKVLEIVRAIDAAKPKAIAVDLETSDWSSLSPNPCETLARVVWVMVGEEDSQGVELPEQERSITESRVCGDWMGKWRDKPIRVAVPAAVPDADGIVRRYYPQIAARDRSASRWFLPGLASVMKQDRIEKLIRPAENSDSAELEPKLIRYTGDPSHFRRIPASAVESPRAGELLRDKIVLLGGTFRAARDKYVTPVGYLDGVEILAYEIEAERLGGVTKARPLVSLIIDIIVGLTLLLALLNLDEVLGLVVSLFLTVVAALVLSHFLFQTRSYFLDIAPAFGGILLALIIEFVRHHLRLARSAGAPQDNS